MAYATIEDLEARWKPIDGFDERRLAEALLADASDMLDSLLGGREAPSFAKAAVCNAARRVMAVGDGEIGLRQATMTAGSYSQNVTYANPSGDIYFTASEKRALGIGRQVARTVVYGGRPCEGE